MEARVTPGLVHARTVNVRESDTVGWRWAFLREVHDAVAGRGESAGRPTDRVAITAPVMKGRREGAVRTSAFGCGEDVQQVAYITLVIMIVLPGTATMRHSLDSGERLSCSNTCRSHQTVGTIENRASDCA